MSEYLKYHDARMALRRERATALLLGMMRNIVPNQPSVSDLLIRMTEIAAWLPVELEKRETERNEGAPS